MLTYDELKTNARKFVSLTSLTPEEFKRLLPAFEQAYLRTHPASKTKTGRARKKELAAKEKERNRKISKIRVRVEHAI